MFRKSIENVLDVCNQSCLNFFLHLKLKNIYNMFYDFFRKVPSPCEPLPEAFSEPSCEPSCEEKSSSEGSCKPWFSCEPSGQPWFSGEGFGPQLKLTTFSIGITIDWKYTLGGRMLFRWLSRSPLPTGPRYSDDLAAAHYQLSHAVPMVGLRPTTEPNHIFYWDYNQLKARSGWLHALGGRMLFRWPSRSALPIGARC